MASSLAVPRSPSSRSTSVAHCSVRLRAEDSFPFLEREVPPPGAGLEEKE